MENYQITLGGDQTQDAALGQRTGPGFSDDEIIPAIERIVYTYLEHRHDASEPFLHTFRRIGMTPFKAALYDKVKAYAAQ